MKVRFIGIGNDGIEYTNNDMLDDYGCVQEYQEKPTEEQLIEDMEKCLLSLQFDLPQNAWLEKCKYEIIE
jgi:hypothetical protein